MMTYDDLFKEYKTELTNAINHYQTSYAVKKRPVPEHRRRNIMELLQAIDHSEDDEILRDKVILIIERFTTGIKIFRWWIPTGRSQLKNQLDAIYMDERFDREAFLKAQVYELQCRAHETLGQWSSEGLIAQDTSKLQYELKQASSQRSLLSIENDELKKENLFLKKVTNQFKQQKSALYDELQTKIKIIEQLHRKLAGIDLNQDAIDKPTSPSEEIYRSFELFRN